MSNFKVLLSNCVYDTSLNISLEDDWVSYLIHNVNKYGLMAVSFNVKNKNDAKNIFLNKVVQEMRD